ncbi:MAG: hypothetical protein LUD53_01425 [Clostridiales bacterium]|nr:hypothetical protein [Clostridiales bacterium]
MKRRTRFAKKQIIVAVIALLLLAVICILIIGIKKIMLHRMVASEITVEVGESCPAVSAFVSREDAEAAFVSDICEGTVFDAIGDYPVTIRIYGEDVDSVVCVRDTQAPVVTTKDVTLYAQAELEPEDFIEEISDRTATTVRFDGDPDFTTEGVREVSLVVEDEGGNITETQATLEVVRDTQAPVIDGVEDQTVTVGSSISYKKDVTVTDDHDENVELNVDASAVDLNTVGDYTVVYSAADAAGNETVEEATIHVEEVSLENVTEEYVNAKADEILESILDDSMTLYEKAEAIYWWCHENIGYQDGASKTSWVAGAYQGLVERRGDCYTYASTAKCLLTQAGITNMDIQRIPSGTSMHYWNLIDIGEGWYHFDTCRRADGSTFFYKTDAEIKAYSDAHNGTHNYDPSLHPDIQ